MEAKLEVQGKHSRNRVREPKVPWGSVLGIFKSSKEVCGWGLGRVV